ncbi:MAG: hypothetical protein JXD22_07920 [Sedimentisphaerales bacterium]|nr:hypothetical protein [Sedimentisphaerales bacterium]
MDFNDKSESVLDIPFGGGRFNRLILSALLIATTIIGPLFQDEVFSQEIRAGAINDPLEQEKSVVWDIYGEFVIRGLNIHQASLRAMLKTGIKKVTGIDDPNQAWHSIIQSEDIVALKFTGIGSQRLGTNSTIARILLQELYKVGFEPKNFMIVGIDPEFLPKEAAGTIPCQYGWQKEPVDFLGDRDYLANWVEQVTAIINIPTFLDDYIIGLRGALANLSLDTVKRPARIYVNQCDPFIPEIYRTPQIRSKVRLHIANCLRILYHGGPEIKQIYTFEHSSLIFSKDPVALDVVGLHLIRRARQTLLMPANVPDHIDASYLDTAAALGLGYTDLNLIDYRYLKHEKWTKNNSQSPGEIVDSKK